MSLRQQAEADLEFLLEDESGFGWPIEVTSPDGKRASLVGNSGDVSATVDPATGALIVGSVAHVALRMRSIRAAGMKVPTGARDANSRPWLVEFSDLEGRPRKFAVTHAMPDHTLGIVVLSLSVTADSD